MERTTAEDWEAREERIDLMGAMEKQHQSGLSAISVDRKGGLG